MSQEERKEERREKEEQEGEERRRGSERRRAVLIHETQEFGKLGGLDHNGVISAERCLGAGERKAWREGRREDNENCVALLLVCGLDGGGRRRRRLFVILSAFMFRGRSRGRRRRRREALVLERGHKKETSGGGDDREVAQNKGSGGWGHVDVENKGANAVEVSVAHKVRKGHEEGLRAD